MQGAIGRGTHRRVPSLNYDMVKVRVGSSSQPEMKDFSQASLSFKELTFQPVIET